MKSSWSWKDDIKPENLMAEPLKAGLDLSTCPISLTTGQVDRLKSCLDMNAYQYFLEDLEERPASMAVQAQKRGIMKSSTWI